MRNLGWLMVLFLALEAGAQDSVSLKQSVLDLNDALLQRDSIKLRSLLHPQCQYGHSNAWIESANEVIEDLFNEGLVYKSIRQQPMTLTLEGKTGLVRSDVHVTVTRKGQEGFYKLHALQVWVWEKKKGWRLIARQSTKLAD